MNYKQKYIENSVLKEFDMITGVVRRLAILDIVDFERLKNINSFNIVQRNNYKENFHMTFPIAISMDVSTGNTIVYYSEGTVISDGRLNCRSNHPWYKTTFPKITEYINVAFNNIVIKAINDPNSTYQRYQSPFGIMTYFNRGYNGSFLGFDSAFNNIIFQKYHISKEDIKDIYHVDELKGDWPYGTEKQIFDLVDYINRNYFSNICVNDATYTIVQLKNKKYIAKFTDRVLSESEINILRSHPGSSKKGVFPEFEKKEDLEEALKFLFS